MSTHDKEKKFLLTEGLARRWNESPRTLEGHRYRSKGCPFHKIGGRVLYALEDVEAHEAASRKVPR